MPSKANKRAAAAAKSQAARAAAEPTEPVVPAVPEVESVQVPAPEPASAVSLPVAPSTPAAAAPEIAVAESAPKAANPAKSDSKRSLKQKKKEYAPCIPPPKLSPLPIGKDQVITNSYSMTVKPKVEIYRIDVAITMNREGQDEPKSLAGSEGGDRRRQEQCTEIVRIAHSALGIREKYVYDGAVTLYTLTERRNSSIIIESSDKRMPESLKKAFFSRNDGSFLVEFSMNRNPPIVLSDIHREIMRNMESGDKSITAFVQLLLVQEAKNKGFVLLDSGSQVFKPTRKLVAPGIEEGEGLGAGVKVAEGANKKGEVQVMLEYKKTQFFASGPLINLLPSCQSNQDKFLRNLQVSTNYGKNQTFGIQKLSRDKIGNLKTRDGEMPLVKLCAEISGMNIKHINPNNRAVEKSFRIDGKLETYQWAMETLNVQPNQRLGPHHGNPPKSAFPEARFLATENIGKEVKILSPNETFLEYGVAVSPKAIELLGYNVPLPIIIYAGNSQVSPDLTNKASWRCQMFMTPSQWDKVILAYNSNTAVGNAKAIMEHMKKGLTKQAQNLGMKIKEFVIEDLKFTFPQFGAGEVQEALGKKIEALGTLNAKKPVEKRPYFIYVDCHDEKTHEFLKIKERRWGIPCQQLCFGKSASEEVGGVTFTNILMKMNVKMGGQNHHVEPSQNIRQFWGKDSNTLIISYDVCHPTGGGHEDPSVVGFAYNVSKDTEMVTGDFHYQKPNQEEVEGSILVSRASSILKTYYETHNKSPKNVIVLRDGVSEGQYGMVLHSEIPSIQKGIEEFLLTKGIQTSPSMAVIVATKRNGHRLFKKIDGKIQNVIPLTAIDHTIVRKNANEVIFVSHCPVSRNGTSQPLLLNILKNEGVFKSNEELVQLMATLCSAHQVSSNIVSLPETIYAADEYAKRGSDIFSIAAKLGTQFPRDSDGKIDFSKVTEWFSYANSVFKNKRIA